MLVRFRKKFAADSDPKGVELIEEIDLTLKHIQQKK
jgi:hypothetical protein